MTRESSNDSTDARRQRTSGRRRIQILVASVAVIALCGLIRHYWGTSSASADSSPQRQTTANSPNYAGRSPDRSAEDARGQEPGTADRTGSARDRSDGSIPAVAATVNSRRITRDDLARDCLRHFGSEVLESVVNKRLILLECQRQGVTVTRQEVNEEIDRMAKRFKIPRDQWLKMLKQERKITAEQYADDIIWPTIALRKLAGARIQVTPQEIRDEYETQYGEQIKVRLIAAHDQRKANDLRAQAVADPKNFGNLAKQYSEDTPSASIKGVINPIRRNGSYKEIEDAVFNIRDGEITPVIHAGGQYVFLQRMEAIPPRADVKYDDTLESRISEFIRDRKTRSVAQDVFQRVQDQAKQHRAVQNVWNDAAKRQRMPGVAATVYDDQITIRELAEQCMARHASEVLEGTINRTLIELECKKLGVTISEDELDREIERMAVVGGKTNSDGSPDVKAWLAVVAKQGVSLEVYRYDAVWPTVAMRKLVANTVKVTEDDLQRGYEANYGERVRCLAIVLKDFRTAERVFEMARKDNTAEHFGDLAAQYSVEPGSQALRGEVPPIGKFGGQPQLEDEAFRLQKDELSGVIQVGDKFIILRCEGRTKPVKEEFAKARDEIYRDIYEKKMEQVMRERFDAMQDAATIDNFLTGASHSPKQSEATPATARVPLLRQVPGR